MRDRLLEYYNQELQFLREMMKGFAQKYRDVATRLRLNSATGKSGDPHVDLMMDAFAFLAGRVQMKLDDEFPEITESFFNVLYPHYLAPIPSMSLVQFVLDPDQNRLTSGYQLPAKTLLYAPKLKDTTFRCQYRSCYPVTLWPLEVTAATLEGAGALGPTGRWNKAVLKLQLRCLNNTRLGTLKSGRGEAAEPLRSLRFYINQSDLNTAFQIYEQLFSQDESGGGKVEVEARAIPPAVAPGNKVGGVKEKAPPTPQVIPLQMQAVGFNDAEAMLPYTRRSFAGYRLLTEYFAFPQKFLFFDIVGLDQADLGEQFEILIHLNNVRPLRAIDKDTFLLGCSPIINLFEKDGVPIDLNHRRSEYRVVPNRDNRMAFEVYSVDEVEAIDTTKQRVRQFRPFYSLRHSYDQPNDSNFWYAARRPALSLQQQNARQSELSPNDKGTEVYLSLVDAQLDPESVPNEVVALKLTCLNRDYPDHLHFRAGEGDFQLEGSAPLSRVRRLVEPTPTRRPPLGQQAQWRLISHLSLNHLSLVNYGKGSSPEPLQEILKLYDYLSADKKGQQEGFGAMEINDQQILGLKSLQSRRVAHQTDSLLGTGIVQGLQVELTFDESQYPGKSPLLFATVLEQFLGLYVSVNSFVKVVARTSQGVLKEWPPKTGEQILL